MASRLAAASAYCKCAVWLLMDPAGMLRCALSRPDLPGLMQARAKIGQKLLTGGPECVETRVARHASSSVDDY